MPDQFSKASPFIKKAVSFYSWAMAAWAPIQGFYAYVSKGNLTWLGVTTHQDLPHTMLFLSWIAGRAMFALTMVTLLVYIVLGVPLMALGERFYWDDHVIYPALGFLAFGAGGIFAIGTIVIYLDEAPSVNPAQLTGAGWSSVLVGACSLGYVYIRVFSEVSRAKKELAG